MSPQPYAKGPRMPGAALSAMLRGKPAYLPNPQDAKRRAMKHRGMKRRRKRSV